MNERIKKLAEQAGLKVNADGEISSAFFGSVDAGYKKFAELLVRECMKAADEGMAQVTMKVEWPSYHIKKHFGVEE